MRAALRSHVLTLALPSVTAPMTLSGRVLTASDVDFRALGFWPGCQIDIKPENRPAERHWLAAVGIDTLTLREAPSEAFTDAEAVSVAMPEIVWEQEAYTPEPGTPFITEAFRRVGGQPVLFHGQWKHNFLVTFSLFWPSGQGTIGPESLAGRLLQHFRPGVGLAYGVNKGHIDGADTPQPIAEPAWILFPVTVSVTAWTDN